MSYCDFCKNLLIDNVHRVYHDKFYGVELTDDFELFGRLILEINQAGLSWETILKKQDVFRVAFDNYNFYKIAKYDDYKLKNYYKTKGLFETN